MAIQSKFRQFDERIKLKRFDENAELREKRDRVLSRLRGHLRGVDWFNQGSYAMGTGIKPLGGRDYDIDVGVILPASLHQGDPQVAKERVFEAVKDHTARVEYRRNCVTVFYQRYGEVAFHVDLAVYAQTTGGGLALAVGKRHSAADRITWQASDPKGFIDLMRDQHQGGAGQQFRRVIRCLKRWKDEHFPAEGAAAPRGIALTACALKWFQPTPNWQPEDDRAAILRVVRGMRSGGQWGRLAVELPTAPGNDVFSGMTDQQMREFLARLEALEGCLVNASREPDALRRAFGVTIEAVEIVPELIRAG